MFTTSSQPRRAGAASAEMLAGNIVCVRFSGHATAAVLEQVLPSVRAQIALGPKAVVFDATGVTSFDSDVRNPGFELLHAFRSAGVTAATGAVTSTAVRMIGSAIAFGAGLPLEFFAKVDDALARARELAEKKR